LWAIIAPANEPSIRLAEKLGFERVHETAYHGDPTVVMKRPAWA
jgi:RimJ/RimL family protein N-acetyltransferase